MTEYPGKTDFPTFVRNLVEVATQHKKLPEDLVIDSKVLEVLESIINEKVKSTEDPQNSIRVMDIGYAFMRGYAEGKYHNEEN